jgi:dipeptidyl aminopeptidase/acylaminoacyl peptidase
LLASVPPECANTREKILLRLQTPTASTRPATPLTYQVVARGPLLFHLSFSADGRRVFGVSRDAQIVVLDTPDLAERKRFPGPIQVRRFVPSSDGSRLFILGSAQTETGATSGVLFAYDVETGAELWRRDTRATGRVAADITVSPDGSMVATMEDDRVYRVWDAARGRMLGEFPSVDRKLRPIPFGHAFAAFSTDGKSLLYASAEGIRGVTLETGEDRIVLRGFYAWSFNWFLPMDDGFLTYERNGASNACVLRKHDVAGNSRVLATRFYWRDDGASPVHVRPPAVLTGRTLSFDHQMQPVVIDARTGVRSAPAVAGAPFVAPHVFSVDGRLALASTAEGSILARRP